MAVRDSQTKRYARALAALLLLELITLVVGPATGCSSDEDPGDSDPSSPPWAADYLLLAGDNGTNRFKVIDPEAGTLVYSLDVRELQPELCGQDEYGCYLFGASHAVIDGHDVLDVTYGSGARAQTVNTGFEGSVDRVELSHPPRLRWRLRQLDFSSLPGGAGAYCPVDAGDPCRARAGAPLAAAGLCWVGDAHDLEVLSDDPIAERAELVVADTDNYRLLKVTLDYGGGNTCGTVTSYLDGISSADWESQSQPNNLVRIEREGRELYLVTFRALTRGDGYRDGAVQLWELEADGRWVRHWSFPGEDGTGMPRSLIVPHGGEYLPGAHPEGDLFRFAHSSSLSSSGSYSPSESAGGSIAVLLLRDLFAPPDYLHDLYQPLWGEPWRFPRFATVLPDRTLLVTDSGCISPSSCPFPARLIRLEPGGMPNSARGGYWTASLSELETIDQSEQVLNRLECGLVSPFWTVGLPAAALGLELTFAAASGGIACP